MLVLLRLASCEGVEKPGLRASWPLVARFYNKSLLTVREFVRALRVIKCKAKVVKPRRVGGRRDATIKAAGSFNRHGREI
jgi:hypothetical protein